MLEEAEDRAARAAVEGRTGEGPITRVTVRADGIVLGIKGEDGIWIDTYFINTQPPVKQPADLVIIETPYSGDVEANTAYARASLLDSLRRGEAPIASHLLHTQVLDDMQPDERTLGIEAGLAWYRVATKCVVYSNRGISGGMKMGIDRAGLHDVAVEYRWLEKKAWPAGEAHEQH
ncbi:hypothetical protein [Ochrobactrum sp. EDr1-4]|uniref:DUF7768 domain-containing protein n=1 Tax=Ochrobactrum sp. EDr1-4 TaxID=3368622 RepID=UPI003BA0DF1F